MDLSGPRIDLSGPRMEQLNPRMDLCGPGMDFSGPRLDLSGNICGCCCAVFPRAQLAEVPSEQEELVCVLLGPTTSKAPSLAACPNCRAQLHQFAQFVRVARENMARLKEIRQEEGRELGRELGTSWSQGREGSTSPQLEISVRASPSPPLVWPTDNTVTITPHTNIAPHTNMTPQTSITPHTSITPYTTITPHTTAMHHNATTPHTTMSHHTANHHTTSTSMAPQTSLTPKSSLTPEARDCLESKEAAAREANRLRNVRYRERKRQREAELRGYTALVRVDEGVERIDVTPDLSITMEEEEEDGEEEEEEEDRPVSPPACHLAPILVPNGSFPSSLMARGDQLDPEERRRRRNREASRRYRERARGDPELLRRMREQQNRRQKKYYARLKERKHDGCLEGEEEETGSGHSGSFDSSPGEDCL